MVTRPVLVGVVSALVGATLFVVYTQRFETEMSGGERVDVLVSARRIERGTPLTDDALTTRSIPQAYVDDRAIRVADREKILGLKAAELVGVSQTLQWPDVITTRDDKRDLSSLVQPGYRAVTAPFTAQPTFSMIRPGDFVDVIVVTAQEEGSLRESIVLLQRVLVLAIGTDTSQGRATEKGKGASTAPILTLSLNVQEAQLLSLAAQRGTLSVALRNPNDQRVAESLPDMDSRTLDQPDRLRRARNYRRADTTPTAPTRIGGSEP